MNCAPALLALLISIPSPRSGYRVHDFAEILSPQVEAGLENLSRNVDQQTSAELAIVTVTSLDGLSVEDYAHELFNQWGIGKKDVNNGVLLLVAMDERRMRIEVGYGIEPLLTDGLCGEIRDQQIIPHFKNGDFVAGITSGAEEIAGVLTSHPDAARGVAGSAPAVVFTGYRQAVAVNIGVVAAGIIFLIVGFAFSRFQTYPSFFFALGALGLGAIGVSSGFLSKGYFVSPLVTFSLFGALGTGLFSFIYNTKKYLRYGPHVCKACGSRLELLDEEEDDAKLALAQRLEEEIGSVDYDVWYCPACLKTETEAYVATFSGFSPCPKCAHRTFHEEATITRHTTYSSSGEKRLDGRCRSCKHMSTHHVMIPRLTRSSSGGGGSGGGGGSFGGGRSGGGGASGGW